MTGSGRVPKHGPHYPLPPLSDERRRSGQSRRRKPIRYPRRPTPSRIGGVVRLSFNSRLPATQRCLARASTQHSHSFSSTGLALGLLRTRENASRLGGFHRNRLLYGIEPRRVVCAVPNASISKRPMRPTGYAGGVPHIGSPRRMISRARTTTGSRWQRGLAPAASLNAGQRRPI
jgi:hypothetical protein